MLRLLGEFLMSKQFNVCAVFGERRSMKSAVSYAGRLASLLGLEKVHVYLPGTVTAVPAPRVVSADAAELQRQRVEKTVMEWQNHPVQVHDDVDIATASLDQLPPNSIVVSNGLALKRRDLTVLQPFDESQVLRASGSILVPFGDGDSGMIAALVAVPLAQALSLEVLFYHTTWRSEKVESDDAEDHMCVNSRAQYRHLERIAQDAGIAYRIGVEMADDVVFGMLHCALTGDVEGDAEPKPVNLIVMAHGLNTHIGSYVEKALKVSATPILVVGTERASGTDADDSDTAAEGAAS
jgi:hypothetical protein